MISLKNLVNKLDREIFEPIIIMGSEGPARSLFESMNVKVYVSELKGIMAQPPPSLFESTYYSNWRALNHNPKPIENLLSELKPSLVHLNDKSVIVAGKVAHQLGYKIVWHLRTSFKGKKSWLQYWLSKKIISESSDHLIAISEDETDGFENFSELSVIANGVDMNEARKILKNGSNFRSEFNIKDDEIAVGMIGNLNSQKGAWNFIRAAGIVKAKCPGIPIRYFVVAPIPPKANYIRKLARIGLIDETHPLDKANQLAEKNGVSDLITFTGRRNDILNVMAGLDFVSACYNMRAIGRPGFEAAAVGKPVIVNQGHSGKSRVVLDGITGIIVEKENPEALAEAMVKLAKDKKLRQQIGKQGLEHAEKNFDAEKNTLKIQEIYLRLIHSESKKIN